MIGLLRWKKIGLVLLLTVPQDEHVLADTDLAMAVPAAIAKAEQSVVAIIRLPKDFDASLDTNDAMIRSKEYGTGVIVNENGSILTNYHLLGDPQNSTYAVVHQNRLYFPATITGADPWTDLAILKIKAENLPPISMRANTEMRKGEFVVVLGNPYGIARDGNVSASIGIIANVSRRLGIATKQNPDTIYRHGGLIQTDARLEFGTSGGPLIDLDGNMIGLVTSTQALAGYDAQASYALPLTKELLDVIDLLQKGRRPQFGFIGIEPEPLALAERVRGRQGVRIKKVYRGTPAFQAKLYTDDIVTHLDGHTIQTSDDLLFYVGARPTGTTVTATINRTDPILRRTKTLHKEIVLGKRFVDTTRRTIVANDDFQHDVQRFGLAVDYATAVADAFSLAELPDAPCVRVIAVDANSPAHRAGLRVGQLITSVNGTPVATPKEFWTQVEKSDGAVELQIVESPNKIVFNTSVD